MSTFTSITEIIKQSLKTQKRRLTQFRNKQRLTSAIWKSRHRHLGISIGIDVGIGIVIFFFPF